MLDSYPGVEHALRRLADAYQPRTGSIMRTGGSPSTDRFPFRAALLDDLEIRTELRARLAMLDLRERAAVFGWYMEGRDANTLARTLRCSARHVHRIRSQAVNRIVELGNADAFADADIAEFA